MSASAFDDERTKTLPKVWLETASSALPDIARDMITRICDEVPDYGTAASDLLLAETRLAVREGLSMFMKTTAWGLPLDPQSAEIFRRLGRREARAGRSHDTLQLTYRVASRSALNSLMQWGDEHSVSHEDVASLSAAVFEFVDELAALSAEGYTSAKSARANLRQARGELLTLLTHRERLVRRQVNEAADRVGWTVPTSVAIAEVVVDGTADPDPEIFGPDSVAGRVGDRFLVAFSGEVDADELRRAVKACDDDVLVVLGPVVPLTEAASSARLAHRLRTRHDARRRARDGVAECDDCLIDLLLDGGRDAARALASERLSPIAVLPPPKRVKYGRLLSAWLEYGTLSAGEPGVLDKHRQTLRYQMKKLEAMFGPALHDRDTRVEIMLALRSALPVWERQVPPTACTTSGDQEVSTGRKQE